jgi:hypothetical protein
MGGEIQEEIMRTNGKVALLGAALLFGGIQPVRAQTANTAALVNSFIGVGEQATSTLNSMAMQHQALGLQREQARQMQQAQQDQAAAQSHHCQPGYTGALIVHADGTRELICEQRR